MSFFWLFNVLHDLHAHTVANRTGFNFKCGLLGPLMICRLRFTSQNMSGTLPDPYFWRHVSRHTMPWMVIVCTHIVNGWFMDDPFIFLKYMHMYSIDVVPQVITNSYSLRHIHVCINCIISTFKYTKYIMPGACWESLIVAANPSPFSPQAVRIYDES